MSTEGCWEDDLCPCMLEDMTLQLAKFLEPTVS